MAKRILAFDIGIKNLAWCCADLSGREVCVKGWANENLISGGTAESDATAGRCESCANKAGFVTKGKGYCVRHCPPLTPALRDLSGALLKKIPSLAVLKEIAGRMHAEKSDLKNTKTVRAFLETRVAFPKVAAKAVKKVELEEIHDGIRAVILRNVELWSSCTEILLENQPVLKNPVMKSVQMMLFASIRDLCRREGKCPAVRLVHAGRKTTGVTKGDEGYSERKSASETRVLEGFRGGTIKGVELAWFQEQKKRSDLADCLSMVMDCKGAVAAT